MTILCSSSVIFVKRNCRCVFINSVSFRASSAFSSLIFLLNSLMPVVGFKLFLSVVVSPNCCCGGGFFFISSTNFLISSSFFLNSASYAFSYYFNIVFSRATSFFYCLSIILSWKSLSSAFENCCYWARL